MENLNLRERIRIGVFIVKREHQFWHFDGYLPFYSYGDSGLDFWDMLTLNALSCLWVFLATRYYRLPTQESIILVASVYGLCLILELLERTSPRSLRPSRPLIWLFGVIRGLTTGQAELMEAELKIQAEVASERRPPSRPSFPVE